MIAGAVLVVLGLSVLHLATTPPDADSIWRHVAGENGPRLWLRGPGSNWGAA
jgi:hypothetical protein